MPRLSACRPTAQDSTRLAGPPCQNLVHNGRLHFSCNLAGSCACRSLETPPLFAHAPARVSSVPFVEVCIPVATPKVRTPVGHHHWTPHLSMQRMRLARLALGASARRVRLPTAAVRDSSSASTDTIVHSRTPACRNSEGTVATTRVNPRPRIRFFVVMIPFTNQARATEQPRPEWRAAPQRLHNGEDEHARSSRSHAPKFTRSRGLCVGEQAGPMLCSSMNARKSRSVSSSVSA